MFTVADTEPAVPVVPSVHDHVPTVLACAVSAIVWFPAVTVAAVPEVVEFPSIEAADALVPRARLAEIVDGLDERKRAGRLDVVERAGHDLAGVRIDPGDRGSAQRAGGRRAVGLQARRRRELPARGDSLSDRVIRGRTHGKQRTRAVSVRAEDRDPVEGEREGGRRRVRSGVLHDLMNPASGTKTQSEGSEFGSCDGKEQTLSSVAVAPPKSEYWMVVTATASSELHSGLASQSLPSWWVGLPLNGSLPTTTEVVPLEVKLVIAVGPPQRSARESATQEYSRGVLTVVSLLTVWQNA